LPTGELLGRAGGKSAIMPDPERSGKEGKMAARHHNRRPNTFRRTLALLRIKGIGPRVAKLPHP
jgi:hypothetical protein